MTIPYSDAHCDTLSRCAHLGLSLRENDGQLDLARLSRFENPVQCFAIFHDAAKAPADGLFAECRRQKAVFDREMALHADLALPCRTAADLRRAQEAGKIAAILTCEGAELLDCDPDRLGWAAEAGIRMVNLTWNHANLLSGSNKYETDRGLNDLGRAFVRRAQELGIRLDVSHCSDAAFWDLVDITSAPLVASHSNARALCPHCRNLTDDMFRAIVETGGFVGLNLYAGFVSESGADMDAFLRHFEHFLSLGGEKHLGFGCDWDGCDRLAGGLQGVQDLPAVWEALRGRGVDNHTLENIFHNSLVQIIT